MIYDSVREELVGKISASKPITLEIKTNTMPNKPLNPIKPAPPQNSIEDSKPNTSEITTKPTSPTLVEFHSKNSAIPEWRLQLQNVVRQRQERETQKTVVEDSPPASRAKLVTSGATALKAEPIEEAQPIVHSNPNLARALQRIENSRQKFLVEETPKSAPKASAAKPNKNYPFYIAGKTNDGASKPAEVNAPLNSIARPKLTVSLKTEKKDLDTNKLQPISKRSAPATTIESRTIIADDVKPQIEEKFQIEPEAIEIGKIKTSKTIEIIEPEEIEEADDYASFAMRFNAGLFDFIIGSFASLILLSPFMLLGGSWLSVGGIFAFLATCAVIMFIYMTTSVGLYGKTLGMRLFSLEVVDIEGEDYPSFHQAAVSSAVYLLSLALGGAGFLTLFFNEHKRAAHDLLSGTIIVREEI